jgi:hypothetical protein
VIEQEVPNGVGALNGMGVGVITWQEFRKLRRDEVAVLGVSRSSRFDESKKECAWSQAANPGAKQSIVGASFSSRNYSVR